MVQEPTVGSAAPGTTQLLIEVVKVSGPGQQSCDIRSGFPRLPSQVCPCHGAGSVGYQPCLVQHMWPGQVALVSSGRSCCCCPKV